MTNDSVTLRAMEPEDLDFLYTMENDCEVWDVGNTNVPYSRYVLHDYIANASNDIYRDGQVRMVVENGDGEAVGLVDVFDFNPRHRRAEVSIVVKKDQRGKGYALDAIAKVINYSRHTLRLHQLYAVISEKNDASMALFYKMGFESANTLKAWLLGDDGYENAILMQKIL